MLSARNLSIKFNRYTKTFERGKLEAISSIDVDVGRGEVVSIIGSSGSGKSLLAHAILGILPANAEVSGSIRYDGEMLTAKRLEKLRGSEIAFVPQSVAYLDPGMKIGAQVSGIHHTRQEVAAIFERFLLEPSVMDRYPHQLSGGMARRVLVAAAVIGGAKLVIADEPTPGLSEGLAREALSLFRRLADSGCAVLLITHDIKLALDVSDRITVFYAGVTVETARRDDFFGEGEKLRHPYTKALWKALPQNGFVPLPGFQPYSGSVTDRCVFYNRCFRHDAGCLGSIPAREFQGGLVRCAHPGIQPLGREEDNDA
jgi:peptide/nickel transport system ATP-binding protein